MKIKVFSVPQRPRGRFWVCCLFTFHSALGFANPLRVVEFDKNILIDLPGLQSAKIAFIDLSTRSSGPKITITNLAGDLVQSFTIPSDRYSPAWTNWGPGISFDPKNGNLWFLSPQVGLTEFQQTGAMLRTIDFRKASHQIQITPDDSFVMPYSWDEAVDAQVSEIDTNGRIIFQWRAADFLSDFIHSNSIAHSQPQSYTATTSAVKTKDGNFYISMSQKDLIVKVDKFGKVLWHQKVAIRPHTLVVHGERLIGYSARFPNRIVLFNDICSCFKEVVINESLGANTQTRSLSLQYLGKGYWFTSGVTGLYILNDDGRVFWRLEHNQLKGRPIGFHSSVIFE